MNIISRYKYDDLMVGDLMYYRIGSQTYYGFILEIDAAENRVDIYWFHDQPPFNRHIYLDSYGLSWFKINYYAKTK